MKKNVWIMNHYATNTMDDLAGRHYWFAENLLKKGYNPTIFCASTKHNSNVNMETGKELFKIEVINGIRYVIVKTPDYKGNGKSRVKNMLYFYKNLFPVAKDVIGKIEKPDVILASSVHPLTLVAGIKIAKKLNIPCICEVRDLWPESIVAYSSFEKNNLLIRALYQGEKWIYKKAHKIIFTVAGGKQYITDQGWNVENGGPIQLSKVHHINNGVDLRMFDDQKDNFIFEDRDLIDSDLFKVVYAGSIRKANNLDLIINAAKYIQENSELKVKFFIFGDGDEKGYLEKKCSSEGIQNVIFKGKVDKKFIPNIVSKSNLNILNYASHEIWKYGGSQNKSFEYLAAGKPILSTIKMGYDLIEQNHAGISLDEQTPEIIGESIISIAKLTQEEYQNLCINAREVAENYDFSKLTEKLIEIIEH